MLKRIVTIILFLVYAPVAVLASPNLVWCVDDDGHSAFEIVTSEGVHLDSVAGVFETASLQSHRVDCVDQQIHSRILLSRQHASAQALLCAGTDIIQKIPLTHRNLLEPSDDFLRFYGLMVSPPPFPQLHQLKTFSLRI